MVSPPNDTTGVLPPPPIVESGSRGTEKVVNLLAEGSGLFRELVKGAG